MTRQTSLPAASNSAHRAGVPNLVAAWTSWAFIVSCLVFVAATFLVTLLQGNVPGALLILAIMALSGWRLAGYVMVTPLLVKTLRFGPSTVAAIDLDCSRALRTWRRLRLPKDPTYASVLCTMGMLRQSQGRLDEAAAMYLEAKVILKSRHRFAYPFYVVLLNNLGSVYCRQERFEEAEELLNEALRLWESQKSGEWNGSGFPLCNLGYLRLRQGRLDDAEDMLLQARRRLQSEAKPRAIVPATLVQAISLVHIGLAQVYARQGAHGDLRATCDKLFAFLAENENGIGPGAVAPLVELSEACMNAGCTPVASRVLALAYELGRAMPDHPDAERLLGTFERFLESQERHAEIPDMKRWLLPVESEGSG